MKCKACTIEFDVPGSDLCLLCVEAVREGLRRGSFRDVPRTGSVVDYNTWTGEDVTVTYRPLHEMTATEACMGCVLTGGFCKSRGRCQREIY